MKKSFAFLLAFLITFNFGNIGFAETVEETPILLDVASASEIKAEDTSEMVEESKSNDLENVSESPDLELVNEPFVREGKNRKLDVDGIYDEDGGNSIALSNLNHQAAINLVEKIMGPGVEILDVRYTGSEVSAGTFQASDEGIIGFKEGVVLSSGDIAYVDGPNLDSGVGVENGQLGDMYLDLLIPGYTTEDATTLEFDFIPQQNMLSFEYVFSSEEYNEFVDSDYNDVFGFFLNGKNIALIPNTNTPVSINNINNNRNSQYYRDNTSGSFNTEMDGLTSVLTAQAYVTPGQKNTIRLSIADAGDSILDSNVFLKAASFSSIDANNIEFKTQIKYVDENNASAIIEITRVGANNIESTVEYYTEAGSANSGEDYTDAQGTITFLPGETSKTIYVQILDDATIEGTEFFYIYLKNPQGNAFIGNNILTRVFISDNDDTSSENAKTVIWEEKVDVPTNKHFIVKFNTSLNPQSVTKENFYVVDSNGVVLENILPTITFDNMSVIMGPNDGFEYNPNTTYTLIIGPETQNSDNKKLGKVVLMNFTTKDLY